MNFLLLLDRIMFTQRYWKSRELTNSDTMICRFLPKELSSALLEYLTYIKPMEAHFLFFLGHDQGKEICLTFIWTKRGKRMSAEEIRRTFQSTMINFGVEINLSSYRFFYYSFHCCFCFCICLSQFLLLLSLFIS